MTKTQTPELFVRLLVNLIHCWQLSLSLGNYSLHIIYILTIICFAFRHSFDHQVLRGNRGGTASNTPPCNSKFLSKPQVDRLRRTSTGSMKTEVTDEKSPINEKPLQQAFMKCKYRYGYQVFIADVNSWTQR